MLRAAGVHANPYINFTARRVAGADLSFLWWKIQALLADLMTTVITGIIVSRDVPFTVKGGADAAEVAQVHPHAGELSVPADVAVGSINLLRGDQTRIQKDTGRVVRTLMHPWCFVRDCHPLHLLFASVDKTLHGCRHRTHREDSCRSRRSEAQGETDQWFLFDLQTDCECLEAKPPALRSQSTSLLRLCTLDTACQA